MTNRKKLSKELVLAIDWAAAEYDFSYFPYHYPYRDFFMVTGLRRKSGLANVAHSGYINGNKEAVYLGVANFYHEKGNFSKRKR